MREAMEFIRHEATYLRSGPEAAFIITAMAISPLLAAAIFGLITFVVIVLVWPGMSGSAAAACASGAGAAAGPAMVAGAVWLDLRRYREIPWEKSGREGTAMRAVWRTFQILAQARRDGRYDVTISRHGRTHFRQKGVSEEEALGLARREVLRIMSEEKACGVNLRMSP